MRLASACYAATGIQLFQSTHPARGATRPVQRRCQRPRGFNPRTPRGVRRVMAGWSMMELVVSIHAPRAGCDMLPVKNVWLSRSFNPRTPRGVRLKAYQRQAVRRQFQSTHPARGATTTPEARRDGSCVSIHAPRAGCDLRMAEICSGVLVFQSTHPARGATSRRNKNRLSR